MRCLPCVHDACAPCWWSYWSPCWWSYWSPLTCMFLHVCGHVCWCVYGCASTVPLSILGCGSARARTPVCPCASSRIHRQPHRYAVAKKAKKYATAERLRYRCTLSLQDLFIWDTFAATTHQSSSTCSNLHSVLGQPASILPQACPDVCLDLACFTTRP